MFDSMYIGVSGLTGYSRGLKVVSNNIANLNSPGFKGSKLQFGDTFYQSNTVSGGASSGTANFGAGLSTLATTVNFKTGDIKQTGNSLDLAVNGNGYFVFRDGPTVTYTRAGQLNVDSEGFLVDRNTSARLAGYSSEGKLVDVSLAGLRSSQPKATSQLALSGNLLSSAASFSINDVAVIDPTGAERLLKLTFTPVTGDPEAWNVAISDAAGAITTGLLKFKTGKPLSGSDKFKFTYAPTGVSAFDITLSLGADATSFNTGTTSTLAVSSNDGYQLGSLTNVSFDDEGALLMTYSNGQTVTGSKLALANFESTIGLQQVGSGTFVSNNSSAKSLGVAKQGTFGSVTSGALEISNVELSEEFSDLIVMQRGYQASSRIISTANQMIAELFDMKGNR